MNISIFGTGYVGLVTGASLANLGHAVLCVDVDEQKIRVLQQGKMPFYEPGLQELMLENMRKERLRFTNDAKEGVMFGEVIFNCVGTPAQTNGAADLSYIFDVAKTVARYAAEYRVLINKSTVPPGTAALCWNIMRDINPALILDVVSNPEFLKQGNAVYDFNHPDKIVVGANSERALELSRQVYHGLIKRYVPLLKTTWETAEMIKYANNSFLATKISFINEIANICSVVNADVNVVAKAIGMDQRIGPKFLNPGIGYGGSCFPKDVLALCHAAGEKGYETRLLREVDQLNERQKTIFVPSIVQRLKEIGGNTITLWGLSFKPKTSDLRGAPALYLIPALQAQGISVKVYDPAALEEARKVFSDSIAYCSTLQESVEKSSAIILVTEWDEFRNVDFNNLGKRMQHQILFDGRNIFESEVLRAAGFEYYGIGRT